MYSLIGFTVAVHSMAMEPVVQIEYVDLHKVDTFVSLAHILQTSKGNLQADLNSWSIIEPNQE